VLPPLTERVPPAVSDPIVTCLADSRESLSAMPSVSTIVAAEIVAFSNRKPPVPPITSITATVPLPEIVPSPLNSTVAARPGASFAGLPVA
jgi:hypothetical protein